MESKTVQRSFLIIALLLASCSAAWGQTTFGSIVGSVMDTSGAVIPGTLVTLTSLGTTQKRVITTDTAGLYEFVNLLPGSYRVEAEKTGFKRFTREPVLVEVQQAVRIDVTMQLGEISQTVEVTAQTPLLQPQTSSLGQVVEQRKVTELPLNGRNPLNLVALVPSVVPQGQSMGNPTGTNPFAWGNYQIGGGMANQQATLLDGSPLNVGYINLLSLVPTQDSLQEFKVQTNSLSAEYGRFAGGVINLTTKSGTNQLHGSVYEFLRNKELNANTFFNNRSGISRPSFTQNQFGANAGGPLVIPHLYNGRDKTFWFASYEGFRQRQGQSFLLSVPTLAMRDGDFSDLRDRNGNLIPIFDPLTTCGRLGNPACARDANGREILTRKQFADPSRATPSNPQGLNILPLNRIDPTAKALIKLWAPPNLAGAQFTRINNFATNASVGGNNDELTVRGDQNVSDKQRIFARYTYWTILDLPIDPYKTGVCLDRCTENYWIHNMLFDDVYSFSPTTIADFRLSYHRFSYDRSPITRGFDLATIGWPASLNDQVTFRHIPNPIVEGFDDIFRSNGTGSVIVARNDDDRFAGSLTKIVGRSTLKFGGEVRRDTHNYAQSNQASGAFNFDRKFTSDNPIINPVGGNGFASYLLGLGSGGTAPQPALVAGQQIYRGLYVEDTFQATSRLTLNLGLRYEQAGPWSERFDRLTFLMPSATNPLVPRPGKVGLVNSPDRDSRNNIDLDTKQFAPRLGFAYRLNDKTVVRGGYGVFWLPNNVAFSTSPNGDPVNSISTQFAGTLDGSVTPSDRFSNPFPNGIIRPPGRDPRFQQILLGQGVTAPVPNNPYGYAQQWNLNIQRELPDGTLVDLAYAGSKGTHLPASSRQLNQLPDQALSLGSALQDLVTNPFFGVITSGPLAAQRVAQGQLLRPFPQYTGFADAGEGYGKSVYHSFQAKVEKRMKGGGSLLTSYTVAKLISTVDTLTGWLEAGGVGGVQNNNNIAAERSIASFDTPQRLVISYVLDLPVGRGKRFIGSASGVRDKLVSGWGVEGVSTFQSGFPLHLGTSQNLTNSFGGGSRPNFNGAACPRGAAFHASAERRLDKWFETSCFSQPPSFTFGNVGRNLPNVRAEGINNFDVSVFKNTSFGPESRLGVQFRAEFFNLLNRPQFGFPEQRFGLQQFGVVSSQANDPRLIQFALRFNF